MSSGNIAWRIEKNEERKKRYLVFELPYEESPKEDIRALAFKLADFISTHQIMRTDVQISSQRVEDVIRFASIDRSCVQNIRLVSAEMQAEALKFAFEEHLKPQMENIVEYVTHYGYKKFIQMSWFKNEPTYEVMDEIVSSLSAAGYTAKSKKQQTEEKGRRVKGS